jgi:hypothetical protein
MPVRVIRAGGAQRPPLFRLTSARPAPNGGRGLLLDDDVRHDWRDKLTSRDLELDKALELIRACPGGAPVDAARTLP